MNTRNIKLTFVVIFTVCILSACSDEDDTVISTSTSDTSTSGNQSHSTKKDYTVYNFIYQNSGTYYLWSDNVPSSIDFSQYDSPEDLFESFRDTDDKFSCVIDNYTETLNSFNNQEKTAGLNYQLYLDSENSSNVIAVVDYVYKDSPAEQAGLKRGMVIKSVNGQTLTKSNYSELLSSESYYCTYTKIEVAEDGSLSYNGTEYTSQVMTLTDMSINPVLQTDVIELDGSKLGYFLYDSFTTDTTGIEDVIEYFALKEIDNLVLDLRFNTGGYATTLTKLASMIMPSGNAEKVFLTETYNSLLTEYFTSFYGSDYFNEYFTDQQINLNIKNLYVLTSSSTASASEELIAGLSPYINVITIGSTTYGKYTSCWLINDEDDGSDYSEWAVYLTIASCKNSNGEMNFKNGFTPDYAVKDTYTYDLGNTNEPLLAKAISLASGTIAKSSKVTRTLNTGDYLGSITKPAYRFNMISSRNIQ